MSKSLILLFLTMGSSLMAQENQRWRSIDRHAAKAPRKVEQNIPDLVHYLSEKADTPTDQIRSFYAWIAYRIQYDHQAVSLRHQRINKNIADILQRRKAICLGYSQLFKALCDEAGIPCEIISGYVRHDTEATPQIAAPDHTWNAVWIGESWQLVDPTWGAGISQRAQDLQHKESERYFLPPAIELVKDHLPSEAHWQLLDCPITTQNFIDKSYLGDSSNCISYLDSITFYRQMDPVDQKLYRAKAAYQFNPTKENGKEIGQVLMDRFVQLSESEETLQNRADYGALLQLHEQLFQIADRAQQYMDLFDWQKEYLGRTHLNHAVALHATLGDTSETETGILIATLKKMSIHLQHSRQLLEAVPPNLFVGQALTQCREYLDFTEKSLQQYESN